MHEMRCTNIYSELLFSSRFNWKALPCEPFMFHTPSLNSCINILHRIIVKGSDSSSTGSESASVQKIYKAFLYRFYLYKCSNLIC